MMKSRPFEELFRLTLDKNGFVDLPVVSHIEGNLYVGCSPAYWNGGQEHFLTIFNFYTWELYPLTEGQECIAVRMYDNREVMDTETLLQYARQVNGACEKGKTLVHCQMGINRSNLVAALALMLKGRSATEAISLLRERRSKWVLLNKAFEDFLLRIKL